MNLVPVKTSEHVEWMRVQRSRPELYKYFRQDKPISQREQVMWWKNINKAKIRLFLIEVDGKFVGYVGFNPFQAYASRAEFGMFIIPEEQGKGYGPQALEMLLAKGFDEYNLACIYSDVLDYPGEARFDFYKKMGFKKDEGPQMTRYRKQGVTIPSIKFHMTSDMWRARNDKKSQDKLGSKEKASTAAGRLRNRMFGSSDDSGKRDLNPTAR